MANTNAHTDPGSLRSVTLAAYSRNPTPNDLVDPASVTSQTVSVTPRPKAAVLPPVSERVLHYTDGRINATSLPHTLTVADLVDLIRVDDDVAKRVTACRNALDADVQAARKELIGYYAPSAVYHPPTRNRDNLSGHTGLVFIDLDSSPDVAADRAALAALPGCALVYRSVRGSGVHALFALATAPDTPDVATAHKQVYRYVYARVSGALGYTAKTAPKLDGATSDVLRPAYFSYDADAVYTPDTAPITYDGTLDLAEVTRVWSAAAYLKQRGWGELEGYEERLPSMAALAHWSVSEGLTIYHWLLSDRANYSAEDTHRQFERAAQAHSEPAGIGTFIATAQAAGWELPAALAAEQKTARNRRALARQDAQRVAAEVGLPLHLHIGAERQDAARLAHYRHADLRLGEHQGRTLVYLADPDGWWEQVSRRSSESVHRHLTTVREQACRDATAALLAANRDREEAAEYGRQLAASYRDASRYVTSLIDYLPAVLVDHQPAIGRVQAFEFDRQRLFRLDDGRGYNPATDTVLDAAAVRDALVHRPASAIPVRWLTTNPSDTATDAVRSFWRRLGMRILERWTAHLLAPPDKSIDCVILQNAHAGKTTAAELLTEATGGMVLYRDAKSIADRRSRFTYTEHDLTNAWLVILDEADKAGEIRPGLLNHLTNPSLDVELKGRDNVSRTRTASLVLLGADYPQVDVAQQGIPERFPWCYSDRCEAVLPVAAWDGADRDVVVSPAGFHAMFKLLTTTMQRLHKAAANATEYPANTVRYYTHDDVTNECRAHFLDERTSDLTRALRAVLVADATAFTSYSDLSNAVIHYDPDLQTEVSKLESKDMAANVARLFTVTTKRKKIGRGLCGVRLREDVTVSSNGTAPTDELTPFDEGIG